MFTLEGGSSLQGPSNSVMSISDLYIVINELEDEAATSKFHLFSSGN